MTRLAAIVVQLGLAAVFLTAAYPKILDAKNFAGDILAYDLVGWSVAKGIAVWLPWMEAIAGLLILIGVWLRPAAAIVTVLSAIFAVAKVSALMRGLQIDCGCFGYSDPLTPLDVGLDAVLIAASVFLVLKSEWALRWFRPIPAIQNHPQ